MKIMVLAVSILALAATGCSKEASDMMRPAGAAVVVSPADGATGVRLDAEVTLTFAAAVDVGVVESGFHLFGARDMADTLCPHPPGMDHGGMQEAMGDSALMRHMIENHSTPGEFSWSGDRTRCAFKPSQWMDPTTGYLVHMGPEVMTMMEQRMQGMAMDGHGSGGMIRHMMSRFATMDTTDGHAGHH